MRIVALQIGQTFYDSFELHTGLSVQSEQYPFIVLSANR